MSSQHTTKSAGQDDLDRLLLTFFQGEMPRKWPAAPSVDVEPSSLVAERIPARSGSGSTSRWVLAASVALLMGLCWFTLRQTGPVAVQPTVEKKDTSKATAGDGPILQEMSKHRALPGSGEPMP